MFHELASYKAAKIVEGRLMGDHVPICISIPPKMKHAKGELVVRPSSPLAGAHQSARYARPLPATSSKMF